MRHSFLIVCSIASVLVCTVVLVRYTRPAPARGPTRAAPVADRAVDSQVQRPTTISTTVGRDPLLVLEGRTYDLDRARDGGETVALAIAGAMSVPELSGVSRADAELLPSAVASTFSAYLHEDGSKLRQLFSDMAITPPTFGGDASRQEGFFAFAVDTLRLFRADSTGIVTRPIGLGLQQDNRKHKALGNFRASGRAFLSQMSREQWKSYEVLVPVQLEGRDAKTMDAVLGMSFTWNATAGQWVLTQSALYNHRGSQDIVVPPT
jgi:hypothetical protein